MCGLAGYSGVLSYSKRLALVEALGIGIDRRGGHAAGYVSLPSASSGVAPKVGKRIGTWGDASRKFMTQAASGEVCMMHSRFATMGTKDDVNNAHPFIVRREGKAVLYGAHNGMLSGTWTSAREHGRNHTVDSREMLELLGDDDHAAIGKLTGYGVVTWITPESGAVYMVRLSDQSDIHIVNLAEGGIAWASTWSILGAALKEAGLTPVNTFLVPEIGQVYAMRADGTFTTPTTGLVVGSEYNYADYYMGSTPSKTPYRMPAWLRHDNYSDVDPLDTRDTPFSWRSDGKLLGRPTPGTLGPLLYPKRRPLSEITLDDMTDAELDTLTDDEWDVICDAYKNTPRKRVG